MSIETEPFSTIEENMKQGTEEPTEESEIQRQINEYNKRLKVGFDLLIGNLTENQQDLKTAYGDVYQYILDTYRYESNKRIALRDYEIANIEKWILENINNLTNERKKLLILSVKATLHNINPEKDETIIRRFAEKKPSTNQDDRTSTEGSK